jgi:hypothetical protein
MKWSTLIVIVLLLILGIGLYVVLSPRPATPTPTESLPVRAVNELTEEWRDYASPSNDFSISLPTVPQHTEDYVPMPNSDGNIKYTMFLAQARLGTSFVINSIQYPPTFDASNSEVILKSIAQEMVAGKEANQLTNQEFFSFQGYPATIFGIANNNVTTKNLAVLQDKKVYVITVADRNPQAVDDLFKRAVDSFIITK